VQLTVACKGAPDAGSDFVVRRIGEPVQIDPLLMAGFARAGLRPGATVRAHPANGGVAVTVGGERLDLPDSVASHVFVAAGQGAEA
jgi:DtxR family Mn-dependent transcriptional regulator